MTAFTDATMLALLQTARQYTAVMLRHGPRIRDADAEAIIWEHGRRNFELRARGVLAIVCPIQDGSGVSGVAIFDAAVEEVRQLMDEDPAIQAGVFSYEVHPCLGFPKDHLPETQRRPTPRL